MPAYTTQTQIENHLGRVLTANEAGNVAMLISGISKLVESYTGRKFVADTEASDRYYDIENSQELFIDDFQELTEVAVEPTFSLGEATETLLVEGTDFIVYPLNLTNDITCYSSLRFVSPYLRAPRRFRVKAKWGSTSTCPDEITQIVTQLVALVFANPENLQLENIENYQRAWDRPVSAGVNSYADKCPPMVRALLEQWRKIYF